MKSSEIRKMWLEFFREKGHDIIPSAPLVPVDDPTLLWINAGVAPLKKFFDGREIPANRRMANSQKCIRTNDIENVGKTARHHTFFEMLGNFSIGDYFRAEALEWGFELLTSPRWFDFDVNRLYFTVYPDDDATVEKWVSLGVARDHIIKLESNFWEIGEGPCGPCTEIYFDRGPEFDPLGRGPELIANDIDNDRYVEIWNIVFSQYNAEAGKPRSEYRELPSKNIDTGMGLERISAIMQGAKTNYDTDLFMPMITATEKLTGIAYDGQMAFKVIADHLRSVVFALADGAILSNEGRGYVVRRLLRRAGRFGKKLGMDKPFLYKLVPVVAETMNAYYPYLADKVGIISEQVEREEEKFLQTLGAGENRLLEFMAAAENKTVDGETAFLLYDTFGFPLELTLEVASEHGFSVDVDGFNHELERQKARARGARQVEESMTAQNAELLAFTAESAFTGYHELTAESTVLALFKDGKRVASASGEALAVFAKTPFYAESGGQIGDRGRVICKEKAYKVTDTIKLPNFQHASVVQLGADSLSEGDEVRLEVDAAFRANVTRNHTATHLLNESLRHVLGSHVRQQGSFVGDRYLRFDFNHYHNLTADELLAVEDLVNAQIKAAQPVKIYELSLVEAQKLNVQAVFGEKYGETVRVVDTDFSKELCGGCHVTNTAMIGAFAIYGIESKGSGIFRIEAATGDGLKDALTGAAAHFASEGAELAAKAEKILSAAKTEGIALSFQTPVLSPYEPGYRYLVKLEREIAAFREAVKELDKAYQKGKREKNVITTEDYLRNVLTIGGYNVLIITTEGMDVAIQKDLIDRLSDCLPSSIVFVANHVDDKVVFVCKNKIDQLHAGEAVQTAARILGGGGGGRKDFAQAGGRDAAKLDEAIAAVRTMITGRL